ncbi:glycosyltransferase [Clostridium sp.]|uniref:glycosyltransferase n=1 Tax=Clostridium sp. TaxID=1506 RepID=UPI0034641696
MIDRIKYYLKRKVKSSYMVQNINLDLRNKNQKRALVAYINNSLMMDLQNNKIYHSNTLESGQILKVLIDRGYVIDACHIFDDLSYDIIKDKTYDLVFGMGDTFKKACQINKKAKKVIYITETEPEISLMREKERLEYYRKRHGKLHKVKRSGVYYNKLDFENVDYGIILGEKSHFKDYDFKKIRVYPSGLYNEDFKYSSKDFKSCKNHFIWFGSNGAIHKGLDILLDVFSKRDDIYLHICGVSDEDRKIIDIPKKDNIIDHGFMDVYSKEYLNLVEKCTFVILPSCGEAMSTSVLTSMRHGLIPVVSKELGFEDLGNKVYILEDYTLDYVDDYINKLLMVSEKELEEKSKEIYEKSNKLFSINNFTNMFSRAMDYIEGEK